MNYTELLNTLRSGAIDESNAFSVLQEISRFVNDSESEENESKGRELVLRALDKREAFADYNEIIEAFTRQVGLFPYLTENDLSLRDSFAYEFHRPEAGNDFVFHRVQAEVYRRLMDGENVILSAPTSFGKSRIIDAIIASERHNNVAVIVPTIALIDETRRRLSKFSNRYKIITQISQKTRERNLFIFTAERLVGYENLPPIDFFVIDEFYKIGALGEGNSSRAVALNQAFYQLNKSRGQFYLLGPSIREIPEGLENKLPCYFIPTRFSTVACDIINVFNWTDEISKLLEIAATLDDPTLIFCKSPKRANDVAKALLSNGLGIETSAMDAASTWIASMYHPDWTYGQALKSGIGLHHGRLPRSLGQLSVRAFNEGKLKYLVCTSTLIEGVNTRAKNVVILDHLINNRRYDFFTFNNIKGRSGRMSEHFVGKVYLFHPPPQEELPIVDFPFFTQGVDTPDSLLVQLDREDLTPNSQERMASIYEQNVLPVSVIKTNSTIDPDAQVEFAKHLAQLSRNACSTLWWSNFPTYDQLRTTNRLLWQFLVKRARNEVTSADQLTVKLWSLMQTPDVKMRVTAELQPGPYQATSPDEAVERVLSFDRNWAGFEFPRLLMATSRIQAAVFAPRFGRFGNYSFFAARVEHHFRNPAFSGLEEFGLPVQLAEKIVRTVPLSTDLDVAIERIRTLTPTECNLSAFESDLLFDVQRNL